MVNSKMRCAVQFLFFIMTFSSHFLLGAHFLSFVMPCFNCAHTVRTSIDSIYQQNLSIPFEVVATDDGSTDATLTILREYEKKYDNFRVIVHETNLGGGAANNTCVAHAKGNLLFRLDSDNILAPNSVGGLIDLLEATGCEAAAFQEKRFFKQPGIKSLSWFYRPANNICDLQHALSLAQNPLHSGNYLYTRKSFDRAGGYPNERSGTDTHSFGFKQYMTGTRIAILPDTFYWHYDNKEGYFHREEKTGRNRQVLWATFKNFEEVFDQATRSYLATVDVNRVDPWEAIKQGKIVLVAPQALESLFQAYKCEDVGDAEGAAKAYEFAISHGCVSQKIINRLKQVKSKIS